MARKGPSDQETADQQRGRRVAESALSSEEGVKQPECNQLVGRRPVHKRTSEARRALGSLAFSDRK